MLDRNLSLPVATATPPRMSPEMRRLESLRDIEAGDIPTLDRALADAFLRYNQTPADVLASAKILRDMARKLAASCAYVYAEQAFTRGETMANERGVMREVIDALEVAMSITHRVEADAQS